MFMRRFLRGLVDARLRLAKVICRFPGLSRGAQPHLERLENRACPTLLGLAAISINPDIASGARTRCP